MTRESARIDDLGPGNVFGTVLSNGPVIDCAGDDNHFIRNGFVGSPGDAHIRFSAPSSGNTVRYECGEELEIVDGGQGNVIESEDTTPPSISLGDPEPAPNAFGWRSCDVSIPFTATDTCPGEVSVDPASPLLLSAEGEVVTGSITATDAAGNSATFTSAAFMIDKTPPTVTVSLSPSSLWPAEHRMVPVTILVTVSDGSSGLAADSIKSMCAASSEGDVAPGTGNTTGDVDGHDGYAEPVNLTQGPFNLSSDRKSGTFSSVVSLRAERSGSNPVGRVYSVTVTAEDKAGKRPSGPAGEE